MLDEIRELRVKASPLISFQNVHRSNNIPFLFQLVESDIKTALIVAEVRERVAIEMEERMMEMEREFTNRLLEEVKC